MLPWTLITMAQTESTVNPVFTNIFEDPKVDDSVFERVEAVVKTPSGHNVNGLSSTNLSFQISDKNSVKDLSEAYILLNVRLTKLDGSELTYTGAGATLAETSFEMVGNNMAPIKSMKLSIGGMTVESVDRAFLRGLICSMLEKRTNDPKVQSEWFYPEIDDKDERGLISGANPSYIARITRRNGAKSIVTSRPNKTLELRIPLKDCFGFVRDNTAGILGQEIVIDIGLADVGFGVQKSYIEVVDGAAKTNAVGDVRLYVSGAELWYHTYTPSSKIGAELLGIINNPTDRPKFTRAWVQHEVIQLGSISEEASSVTFTMPQKYSRYGRVYIFAMSEPKKNSNTHQVYNSTQFDQVKWTNMSLSINGSKSFPTNPYQMDWTNRAVTRQYSALVEAQRVAEMEQTGVVDFESFLKTYPIVVFDISSPGQALTDQTTQTTVTLDCRWETTPVVQPGYPVITNSTGIEALTANDRRYTIYACVELHRYLSGFGDNGSTVFDQLSTQ